jgi:hypothetical protein
MAELPTQRDFDDFSAWTGRDVLTPDGERLGAVELIFLDEATDVPEWVLVALEEADGSALVPLAGATVEEQSIRVEQDRERIAAAPRLEVEDTITVAECRRLYEHYGLAYSQEESPTVLPEGAGAQAAEERPRLRKYIGAPVPAAAGDEGEGATDAEDATASMPTTKGTGPAEPVPNATAPPAPIAPPTPRAIPPEGGFQAHEAGEENSGGPLALLKRRPALPITFAGGIAALIAILVLRKRR